MSINIAYSGVQQVQRGHATFGMGQNCIATLGIVPQFGVPAVNGTLFITDAFRSLTVPGCRLDEASIKRTPGGQIVAIQVLGPTWKWQHGTIDGVFNVRKPDGSIVDRYRRSTQELATLLFQAMGGPQFDVGALPNIDPGPFVNWYGAHAFAELTILCHQLGCDFGYDPWSGTARIFQVGVGPDLPGGGFDMTVEYGVNLSEPPDVIEIRCGRTVFQTGIVFENVMEETDTGELKKAVDHSATPGGAGTGSWDGTDPYEPLPDDDDTDAQRIVERDLWQLWRGITFEDESLNVPGYGPIESMDQILPLLDTLADSYQYEPWGTQYEQHAYLTGTIAIPGEPASLDNTEDKTPIPVGFSLNGYAGILRTDRKLFRYNDDGETTEAKLQLHCSFFVKSEDRGHYVSYAKQRQIAKNGTGTATIIRPDLHLIVVDGQAQNQSEIDAACNLELDAAQAEYTPRNSLVKEYVGVQQISLSGTVRQLAFVVNMNENCHTTASQNTEFDHGLPRRRQRRLLAENIRAEAIRKMEERNRRRIDRRIA